MTRYETYATGDDGWTDWVQPVMTGYKLACCDCGLVHTVDFRVRNGRVEFRIARNNRATAAMRAADRRRKARGT